MKHCFLIVIVLATCVIGCTGAQIVESMDSPIVKEAVSIKPGSYTDGPECERIATVLANSNVNIDLDYHLGIRWYDESDEMWVKIEQIEDIKPILDLVPTKELVTVSTGKAAWDKHAEYTDKIVRYAKSSGFRVVIVTDASAQATVISKIIQHEDK